jgi:hypothetical protein
MTAPSGVCVEPPSVLFGPVIASILWSCPPLAAMNPRALADANSLYYQSPGAVNAHELPRHALYSVQRPLVAVSGRARQVQFRERRGLSRDRADSAAETGNLSPRLLHDLGGDPNHE